MDYSDYILYIYNIYIIIYIYIHTYMYCILDMTFDDTISIDQHSYIMICIATLFWAKYP